MLSGVYKKKKPLVSVAVIQKTRILKCLSFGLDFGFFRIGFLVFFRIEFWFLSDYWTGFFRIGLVTFIGLDVSNVVEPVDTRKRVNTRFYRKFTNR